jgi:hypothetical protein
MNAFLPTLTRTPHIIRMHENDNVAIVANDGGLDAGAVLPGGVVLCERVPQGHKLALAALPAGSEVRRYNVVIGHTVKDLPAGSWVNERVLDMPAARSLEGLPISTVATPKQVPVEGFTFEGYRNRDGTVGTRNILAITQTVQCVAGVIEYAIERIRKELLPRFPQVDDVVGLEHGYGCGVAIDAPDAKIPIRTLRNLSLNPNFGGEVMLVSLGCEKLQPDRLMPPGTIPLMDERVQTDVVCLQDDEHVGFMSMVEHIMRKAEQHLVRLNARRRETCPAADLIVGVQCGGSDAFSGVTANPAVGFCTDLLVRAGATVMFSEVTEVRDGIDQLTSRASTPRSRRGHDPGDGLVRRLPREGPRRPQRQHLAGQQEGRPLEHRREGDGFDHQVRHCPHQRCALGRPAPARRGHRTRPGVCRHSLERLHLRHASTGGRHESACVYDRPRNALWPRRGSGDQGSHPHRLGTPLARSDGRQRRPHCRRRSHHRGLGLGYVSPDARCGQRAQEDLGRALETA